MTNDEIKHLFRFLKDVGIYKSYVINTNKSKHSHMEGPRNAKEFLTEINSNSAIIGAFVWSKTKEGHRFWSYISDYWDNKNEYDEKNIEYIKKNMPPFKQK